MSRKEPEDKSRGFPVTFRYTGHPQPDATGVFDKVAGWILANHPLVFSVFRSGELDIRDLQTFEDYKAEQDAGLAATSMSKFNQWRAGTGPALTPLKPTSAATVMSTPGASTSTADRDKVMLDQFNIKTKEVKEHNRKLIESSTSVVGSIQMHCDENMVIKLKEKKVWNEEDISIFWPVVYKLITTEDAPTTTKSAELLLATYYSCVQLLGQLTSAYINVHIQNWEALTPLSPDIVISEAAAVAHCLKGMRGAEDLRKRLDDYERDAGTIGGGVATSIRPKTYSDLVIRMQREEFWLKELQAHAAKTAGGKKTSESHNTTRDESPKGRDKNKNKKSKGGAPAAAPKDDASDTKPSGKAVHPAGGKLKCNYCKNTGHVDVKDGRAVCFKLCRALGLDTKTGRCPPQDSKPKLKKKVKFSPYNEEVEANMTTTAPTAQSHAWAMLHDEPLPEDGEVSVAPVEPEQLLTNDNACTKSIFKDRNRLSEMMKVPEVVVRSTAGKTHLDSAGLCDPIGVTALYNPKGTHNLLAHKDLREAGYKLTFYDDDDVYEYSHQEARPTLRFERAESDLYQMPAALLTAAVAPAEDLEANQTELQLDDLRLGALQRDTIEERLKAFSPKDQRNIARAMIAYVNAGFPGLQTFTKMLLLSSLLRSGNKLQLCTSFFILRPSTTSNCQVRTVPMTLKSCNHIS